MAYQIELRTWKSQWIFEYENNGFFSFHAYELTWDGSPKSLGSPFKFGPIWGTNGWNVSPTYRVTNIKAVELIVDSIPVSTFKRAVVGSLVFGGVGAVAGALSSVKAKPKSKISVAIYLDIIDLSSVNIPCKNLADANRLISTISNLEDAVNEINAKKIEPESNDNQFGLNPKFDSSISDEIMKLKKMLDDEIIDEEEFKTFKKNLMK